MLCPLPSRMSDSGYNSSTRTKAVSSGRQPPGCRPAGCKRTRWRQPDGSLNLPNEPLGLLPKLRRDHEIRMRLGDMQFPVLPELAFGVGCPLASAVRSSSGLYRP
jgi:hypothetical protein